MALEVGVDCEEIRRFRRIRFGERTGFYRRVFTPAEIAYCRSFRDPYPRFAARFAAKEAVIKALSGIGVAAPALVRVQVINRRDGRPVVSIPAGHLKGISIRVSLSHSRSHAIAFAVISDDRRISRSLIGKLSRKS